MPPERVGAILVAAGRSTRMGFDKVWADLAGRPVLAYSLAMLATVPLDDLVVVVAAGRAAEARRLAVACGVRATVCVGGARRRDSVASGLRHLTSCEWVVVHDGARPLATADLVQRGLEAARATGAAVPAIPLVDTVKRARHEWVIETVPREDLWRIQTPQVFSRPLLEAALAASDEDVGDEATLVERLGGRVRVFAGAEENIKLTRPGDLMLARALLHQVPTVLPGACQAGVADRLR